MIIIWIRWVDDSIPAARSTTPTNSKCDRRLNIFPRCSEKGSESILYGVHSGPRLYVYTGPLRVFVYDTCNSYPWGFLFSVHGGDWDGLSSNSILAEHYRGHRQ